MTVRRARHYPTPTPAAELLAAERCDHGEIIGRCALCRVAAEPPADQTVTTPTETRPRPPVADEADQAATPAAAVVEDDDQDPRSTPWWTW